MGKEITKRTKMGGEVLFLQLQILIAFIVLLEIVVLGIFSIGWSLLSPWLAPLIVLIVIAVVVGCATLLNQLWHRYRNLTNRSSKTRSGLLVLASVSGLAPTWFWYIQVFDNHNFNLLGIGSLVVNASFIAISAIQAVCSFMQSNKSK